MAKGQQKLCANRGVACLVPIRRKPLVTDEPDALIGHVRVCGEGGGQPLPLPGRPTGNKRGAFFIPASVARRLMAGVGPPIIKNNEKQRHKENYKFNED
jgi:hypothetical protein